MQTLSFYNNPQLKAEHVAQAEHHAAADMLASGTYGETIKGKFRGCSVGCFAHDINPKAHAHHEIVAEARGLPEWLVRLQDSMFEGLPQAERATFHVELARRIPVGVSLDPVQHWIAVARIDRALATQRTALEAKHAHGVHEAIKQTIAALEVGRRAHEAAAGGNSCDLSAAWSAAWSARSARSAARSAWSAAESARSAAESAAWSARSAAWSARSAAESAAWSARSAAWSARSAAESAAWSARSAESAWIAERDALFAALDKAAI